MHFSAWCWGAAALPLRGHFRVSVGAIVVWIVAAFVVDLILILGYLKRRR